MNGEKVEGSYLLSGKRESKPHGGARRKVKGSVCAPKEEEALVNVKITCFIHIIIYLLSLCSLHFVKFRFHQYASLSTSAKPEIFLRSLKFFFNAQTENAHKNR